MSGGMTPSKNKSNFWDGDVNWFSSKDIKTDELTSSELKITREATEATGLQVYSPGCMVMVARSGILKRTFPVSILRVEGTVNQDLKVLSPFVDGIERYLQILLRGMTGFILTSLVKTGTTVQSLKYEEFEAQPFPLPPLAEQHRIVAKVDELMALCDRLEAQQQERENRHAALARASLARFADAPTPENLEYLFHPTYAIAPGELRKAVLTLAVRGRLVAQETGFGATRVISMEELVGRRNMKNGLSLPLTAAKSAFVSLPLSALQGSTIDCSVGKPIDITADRAAPYLVKPHEVYIMRGNGSKERVGIAGMVRTCSTNVLFPDLFIHIPLPLEKIEGEYFLIAWNSPVTREILERLATTTSGIWKVNQGHISECEIPVPPLREQRRIIVKVNQLMLRIQQLEARIATFNAIAVELLDALIAELAPLN